MQVRAAWLRSDGELHEEAAAFPSLYLWSSGDISRGHSTVRSIDI
jgi:hypothetical protein